MDVAYFDGDAFKEVFGAFKRFFGAFKKVFGAFKPLYLRQTLNGNFEGPECAAILVVDAKVRWVRERGLFGAFKQRR